MAGVLGMEKNVGGSPSWLIRNMHYDVGSCWDCYGLNVQMKRVPDTAALGNFARCGRNERLGAMPSETQRPAQRPVSRSIAGI